ncbi:hypothetical protein ACKC9G_13890 [Pokkaliibacter sp. CJK22405]|uniref:hypothetical protein n=1 Tax=Pokkaliibacter sp. CJK22405 TaxID=3384615 RepID=UPI003984A436
MKFPAKSFFLFNLVLVLAIGCFGGYAIHLTSQDNYETDDLHSIGHWILSGPDTVHLENVLGTEPFARYTYSFNDNNPTESLFFRADLSDSDIDALRQKLLDDGYEVQPADDNGKTALRRKGGDYLYLELTPPKQIFIRAREKRPLS